MSEANIVVFAASAVIRIYFDPADVYRLWSIPG
jgi:hypothetical protein